MIRLLRWLPALLLLAGPAAAQPGGGWTTSWATAPLAMTGELAVPATPPGTPIVLTQTVRLSTGGSTLRVRLTNRYGTAPLRVAAATVGRADATGARQAVPGSERALRFGGAAAVTIPAGADYWSDPVALALAPRAVLSIRLSVVPDGVATGHPGARTTTHLAVPGAAPATGGRWFYLAAVDVTGPAGATIAVLGDSITDGYGVKTDSDGRWTDYLATRLQADPATRHLAVANLGIGGNRLLLDGVGPNALARFERDVLALANVRYLIVMIGVNDLGTLTRDGPVPPAAHAALIERMIAGYRQLIARARAAGITVVGVPILPYGGSAYYHPDPANEADRRAVNAWLRSPGSVDALLDLDAALRDPARPARLRADADSGDGLHPSDAGYRAMAEAVPPGLFAPMRTRLALTFDDLPEHGPLPRGETAAGVARSLVTTLRAYRVAEAYGFVNAAGAERMPPLREPLAIWRGAGQPLASHGWSHARLDTIGAARFAAELAANEPVLAELMPAGGWRYFRYPYLAEGRDAAEQAAARRTLAERGYRIAPVSLDFSDWRFNTVYARCRDRGDRAGEAALATRFLAAARESLAGARAAAHARFGRAVPLVLLLHAGAFTARMLPRLLDLYRVEDVELVPLGEVLRDPAYAVARDSAAAGETDPLQAARPDTAAIDRLCA